MKGARGKKGNKRGSSSREEEVKAVRGLLEEDC